MLVATRALARRAPASSLRVAHLSTASALEAESERFSIYNPTEEHVALRQMVRSFAEQEVDPQRAEYNEKEQFNRALFARCGELGLLGVTADESCGGSGMDAVAACVVHEELSAADPAFALSYLAHSMLYVNNVNLNASEDQKRRWLPGARDAVCDGSKVCAMAMSEPGAGTDVLGMRTAAVDAGDHYVLNGSKMWITNGCVDSETLGDGALVYARTGPGRADVSLFHVGPENPGFSLGQRITGKLGMRASPTAELVFEDCVVPKEDLVSEWNGAALCMMRNLELERVVLAAMAVGIAKRCVDRMGKYAAEGVAFGRPIADRSIRAAVVLAAPGGDGDDAYLDHAASLGTGAPFVCLRGDAASFAAASGGTVVGDAAGPGGGLCDAGAACDALNLHGDFAQLLGPRGRATLGVAGGRATPTSSALCR
ncbi:isovaleryl-CoA dehydrogenase [Aureococcus anophagefferens]|nr:isovaleryl-CoA dehydrogenase [Aureococcus anophagefferens]